MPRLLSTKQASRLQQLRLKLPSCFSWGPKEELFQKRLQLPGLVGTPAPNRSKASHSLALRFQALAPFTSRSRSVGRTSPTLLKPSALGVSTAPKPLNPLLRPTSCLASRGSRSTARRPSSPPTWLRSARRLSRPAGFGFQGLDSHKMAQGRQGST